jgi:hypothetical protein
MPTVTLEEIERHHPDVLLPPDPEFADSYREMCNRGREIAAETSVAFVAIARNAQPWLPRTLALLEETGAMFREWSAYIHENDSADDTKEVLAAWQDGQQRHASLNTNGRPHLNFTTATVRTHALAEYRNACLQFVKNGDQPEWVVVFDVDPWGGWSVDGVANSIAWLDADRDLYGLAAYSWGEWGPPIAPQPMAIHYDAFAARVSGWRQRDQQWFFQWHPPVGAPPVRFNSAFGQMAIYRGDAYVAGTYGGADCEHVVFNSSIAAATQKRFALNPSMRCVSFWVPDEAKHGGG